MNWFLIAVILLTVQSKAAAFPHSFKTQAVRGTGNNMFPQWSQDGKRIAFTSDRDGDPEIYVMNADGTSPRRLTHTPGRDAHPFFSRDGRRIVFQSPRANGVDTNIYVMNSDGANVVQLTNLKGFAGVPVYSPDEKLIVFQWRETNNFEDNSKWRICLMNTDGSGFRVITPGLANDQVPNWSRDGKRLLFYSDRTGKDQLYTMKPDGTDVRRVFASEFNDNAAFWSRDNRKISFTSDRDGKRELYVMDADGKNVRRLTNTRATERLGVWSPDATKIAFSSDGDGPAHIYVTNLDGSKVVCLTDSKADVKSVLLVSLIGERQVALIDPTTQAVLAKLPSPQGPHEINLSPDGALAYVSDSGAGPNTPRGNSIVVLDLRTLSVKGTFKTCESPHDTRVSRNGRILWVACAPSKAIVELDATTGAIRKTWDTKLDGGWFVEVTPDDRKLFVPHLEAKALSMIDRRTSLVRTLFSGNTIFGVTVSPAGNEIWVSDADENRLSIVDAATGTITKTISLGAPKKDEPRFSRLRFTPDGKRVVVVRGSEFLIVDVARRSIVSKIEMPHAGKVVTVSDDNLRDVVTHQAYDSVSIINLGNATVERTFTVGKQPDGIAWALTR
jgi:TolB protein